jgi:uncharacterized protein YqjF (DUF2071 family)
MMGFHPDRQLTSRPSGARLMRQTWRHLLFMHWPIDEALLAPMLPPGLEVDQHDGSAWIGLIPFSMEDVRPAIGPAVPGLSSFGEVNVRTYVTFHGEPGVWFFSLDASNPLAVWFARTVYHLPYFRAAIDIEHDTQQVKFSCRRRIRSAPNARFEAVWKPGAPLGRIKPGSLAWFLTERYRLFTSFNGKIRTGEVRHDPWPLRNATLVHFESTLIEAAGLPTPSGAPVLHYSDELAVEIWPLRNINRATRDDGILEPEGAAKPV